MKSSITAMLFAAGATCAFAADYYVNPNAGLGDDAWDGTRAVHVDGTTQGPKKTLTGAMAITGLGSGDIVYAAEGTYDTGNSDVYRVKIPAGVKLIASGRKDKTFIVGAPATDVATEESPWGCGPDALRCAHIGAGAVVQGFTMTGGRGDAYNGTRWHGGVVGANTDSSLMVDCVISNCVAGRGAGAGTLTAVRCEFLKNRASTSGANMQACNAYNCYVHDTYDGNGNGSCSSSTLRNCTVDFANYSKIYNSYVIVDRSGCTFTNSIVTTKHANSTYGDNCYIYDTSKMMFDENCRPIVGANEGIDKGNLTYYSGSAPEAVQELLDRDFAGGERFYGTAIDIGCGEYVRSPHWYVDPNDGDDTWDGSCATRVGTTTRGPKKTLVGAMAIKDLASGDTVHAAEGVYDSRNNDGYRVQIPAGVKLVASGRKDRTFIMGGNASGVATDDAPWGCGTGAIRCAWLKNGAELVGFTITGGRSAVWGTGSGCYVGGVNMNANSLLVDCVVSNCVAGRSAGVQAADLTAQLIRCEITGNRASAGPSIELVYGTAFNCYIHNYVGSDNYGVNNSRLVNCTVTAESVLNTSVYNSYVYYDRANNQFYYSRYSVRYSTNTTSKDVEDSHFVLDTKMRRDANQRPLVGYDGINAGSNKYYEEFAIDAAKPYLDKDFAGGERILNDVIDIGCGERIPGGMIISIH